MKRRSWSLVGNDGRGGVLPASSALGQVGKLSALTSKTGIVRSGLPRQKYS
jgi:hypothetical protein